jgi:single-strand DNA-binding protein
MAYVNKIFLLGFTGKDPEVRTFENGSRIASFTLATTKRYTDRNGDAQQQTMWHNIQVSGNSVDFVQKYVKKGDLVFVEGELTERTYKSQEGEVRRVYEVRAASVQMVGQKPEQNQQQTAAPSQPQQMLRTTASMQQQRPAQAPAPAPAPAQSEEYVDDLPF